MNRFVEAIGKEPRIRYRGIDVIPGTDKIRTYASNVPGLYSRESDLENIVSEKIRERHNIKKKVKRRTR